MRRETAKGRDDGKYGLYDSLKSGIMGSMNCAIPGVIKSFDKNRQTAVIQPVIRRKRKDNDGNIFDDSYPLLVDVPVHVMGGGGSAITFPIKEGDECLVIFADANIDAWWQSGGVQNQVYPRSHSLSDGFAIVGFRSAPNALSEMADDMPEIDNLRVKGDFVADNFEVPPGPPGPEGKEGEKGDTGTGIDEITVQFGSSIYAQIEPDNWRETGPYPWVKGLYLWSRYKIVYKNPASTEYTKAMIEPGSIAGNSYLVGGRNLILAEDMTETAREQYLDDGVIKLEKDANASIDVIPLSSKKLEAGGYALSFSLKVEEEDMGNLAYVQFFLGDDPSSMTSTFYRVEYVQNYWKRRTEYFTIESEKYYKIRLWNHYVGDVHAKEVHLKDMMLERGNIPSAFVPAPEDFRSYVDGEIRTHVYGVTSFIVEEDTGFYVINQACYAVGKLAIVSVYVSGDFSIGVWASVGTIPEGFRPNSSYSRGSISSLTADANLSVNANVNGKIQVFNQSGDELNHQAYIHLVYVIAD